VDRLQPGRKSQRICFDPVPEYAGSCIVESVDALALAEAVTACASRRARASIWPPIRSTTASSRAVTLTRPACTVSAGWSIRPAKKNKKYSLFLLTPNNRWCIIHTSAMGLTKREE